MSGAGGTALRFEALDALRGVCAILVALYHLTFRLNAAPPAFIAGSAIFVDFFFVLSGFVIAWSYGARLANGYSLRDFAVLRLGRVYPLHAVVLGAMVAFELLIAILHSRGIASREAFGGPYAVEPLLGSAAMIHIFGLWGQGLWNGPSWSIAAELWTYLVFAAVCRLSGGRFAPWMLGIGLACALWLLLDGGTISRTASMGLPRCLFGFGLGVMIARYRSRIALPAAFGRATAIELACVAAAVLFVALVEDPYRIAGPLVFAGAVGVFSFQRGAVSWLLLVSPMRWLGRLSYAIYMTHHFILTRMAEFTEMIQPRFGVRLVTPCAGRPWHGCFVADPGITAGAIAVFVAVVLLASWAAFHIVEQPCREWSRRWVKAAAARRAGHAGHAPLADLPTPTR